MFIYDIHVLHMMYAETHFAAASFLRNQSASDIWQAIHTYVNLYIQARLIT